MGGTVSKIVSPITNLFDPPKPPRPRPVTILGAGGVPGRADPEVQEAAVSARRRGGRGRASTILAALEGQLPAGAVAKRMLGG